MKHTLLLSILASWLLVEPMTAGATPITSSVIVSPSPTDGTVDVTLTAHIFDQNSNISGAEFFIDAVGVNGTGSAMTGLFGSQSVDVSAEILAATLSSFGGFGQHVIYVRGEDSGGFWGPTSSTILDLKAAVPEPATLVLVGIGLAGLGAARRRKTP